MVRLDDILEKILSYNPSADLDAVRKAYVFSAKVHQGQTRLSGEPYLTHPMEVAFILAQLRMDVATVVTGLLHDTIEDTLTTLDEIRTIFGNEVATLVDGVTKISKMFLRSSEERQAENFRKMLIAMARDIRVILVKLADRLHNMRTLGFQAPERQLRIARETLDIYAPLANRLGISWIKSELEDLSFKHLEPAGYNELAGKVARRVKEREAYVDQVKDKIRVKLEEHGIRGEVSGRSKHLYSVYRKMERQGIDFEQVYDLIAFRVLVDSVRECYEVLGIVHSTWKPIPGRFKDYIAMPKANMYQSLHTTVIGPFNERIEVQIRTWDMHRIAEEGIAAHWKYKEGKGASTQEREERGFGWLRQLLEWQQELKDSREFMDTVKIDLFPEEVFVFTPKGEVKELPKGSTPVDFAYSVHTDVGHTCVGARVNGRLVPLKTELRNGDVIEVMTAPNHTPSKDWLKFVRTSKARNKIRQWIKSEQREKSIGIGRDLLEKELRKYGMSFNRAVASPDMARGIKELGFDQVEDVLAAIGYGKLSAGQVTARVVPQERLRGAEEQKPSRLGQVIDKIRKKPSSAIKIQGIEDIMVRFAKCCGPLPGDAVVGFITRGRGVTVHTADCPHVLEADPERRVDIEWDLKKKASRPVKMRVYCVDQKGMLAGITGAITNSEANIISASVHSSVDGKGINNFVVDVQNLEHFNKVVNALLKVKGVYKVERLRG
ncbi:RelA/SpoT family protein [Geoalkalibacter halelectricus]|uniref:Bifunctional (P)ppGpp synthetase/guanosine-3',5'-bis(Diphosphate) 3'-pyrophosphohydrolase n=1 Tax=Geoalkalibacter halelectricus TaxID=2847045 RepID=A0ABY5ZJ12_9BACT|nr:bifunctional (p)ppGpp synthetase/guanosine-3',5'-bis(diphosphate) 3'-pyrophosphohydrolase [Geoalkalibacter halelectricus]MDO3376592.1 bifunctional (p)ppGpp synthetase/guanosine-3',5'-bis(diphosphate) 3'-pyrophosphohydrolase [Geoalkalibacter halelectricus]UWZ78449.1 bifunctional (p)ppGpp synthetase/guanosine-3',5'-bis(diphosphate) 3'-pyrophosphohydrolase [Geoalkalibacter halelectricus]